MTTLLLIVIYLVFISFGLPDGVFGGAWPTIRSHFNLPIEYGGIVSLVVTLSTVASSLATTTLVHRLGTGKLLILSTALTALSLFGFSQTTSFLLLLPLAIPLGFGAGAIDSALNSYVAEHYKAHHMNWLHAFWGIGATIGPVIYGASLASSHDWRTGYGILSLIQFSIVLLLVASLPLWSRVHQSRNKHQKRDHSSSQLPYRKLLKKASVRHTFITFLVYTGLEVGVGLWLASYLVETQSLPSHIAAFWTGIYFAAITIGRIATGFASFKVQSHVLVRTGILLSFIGAILLALNVHPFYTYAAIVFIGLGFAPVFPGLIHLTPKRFGSHDASKVMSLQMVAGYLGASIIPPAIGAIAGVTHIYAFAAILPVLILVVIFSTEKLSTSTN